MNYLTQWQVLRHPASPTADAKLHGFLGDRWIMTSNIEEVLGPRLAKTKTGSLYTLVGPQSNAAIFPVSSLAPLSDIQRLIREKQQDMERDLETQPQLIRIK